MTSPATARWWSCSRARSRSTASRSSITTGNRSVLEADCGKGTYVRAIARDLGRALGCLGHIAALRRTRVGPFTEADAVTVDDLATDPAALAPGRVGP